jgi:hypothetical protein
MMYEIKNNIPVPKRTRPTCAETLTFRCLDVGQSFDASRVLARNEKYRVRNEASRTGKKCSIRDIDGTTRIWRTA